MKILLTFSIFHFIWFIENLCFILILKEKMTIFHNKVCVFIMIFTAYLRFIFNEEKKSVRLYEKVWQNILKYLCICSQMFFKIDALKNFSVFTGEHLWWRLRYVLLIFVIVSFNSTRNYSLLWDRLCAKKSYFKANTEFEVNNFNQKFQPEIHSYQLIFWDFFLL